MTVLQRLLGSINFLLNSIILASNGIIMHLWTCLSHSTGKKALHNNALVWLLLKNVFHEKTIVMHLLS